MQCTNTRVYKVNENRFRMHWFTWQEDGIMDYDCLADWQPPINMSDTFLDCLSTCLVASQHTFCQPHLSATMYPVTCVTTLCQSLAVLNVLLSFSLVLTALLFLSPATLISHSCFSSSAFIDQPVQCNLMSLCRELSCILRLKPADRKNKKETEPERLVNRTIAWSWVFS